MKTFICDVDGVLLNTGEAFAALWSELLGQEITEAQLINWKMEIGLGIDPKLIDIFWDEIWDRPIKPYHGASVFIDRLKYLGYKVVLLTSRSTTSARKAVVRDLKPLWESGIDDLLLCDARKGEKKSTYINQGPPEDEPWFFLDDHVKNAVDAKLNCTELKEVLLFDRPWNTSADLCGYLRITSYGDALSRLSKEVA